VDVGVPITDAANVAFEVTDIDRVKADLPKKIIQAVSIDFVQGGRKRDVQLSPKA